jgi:hypothetical protein
MKDAEQRATALCASPTGCAFLLYAEAGLLPTEAVAEPVIAAQIAATAVGETIYFRGDHERILEAALAEASRLPLFARAIMEHPAAERWFPPLDRSAQEWLGPTGAKPPLLVGSANVHSPPTKWERLSQEPTTGIVTSTGDGVKSEAIANLVYDDKYVWEGQPPPYQLRRPDWQRYVPWSEGDAVPAGFGEVSSELSALLYHSGDHHLGKPPLVRYRLHAAEQLRVYEVDGPHAWHHLCIRYPVEGRGGRLVPAWSAFVQDWNAVHLSLGGLLTADQVRVESAAGWTELEIWEFEQTRWLRWRFDAIERVLDRTNFDFSPLPLPTPPAFSAVRTNVARLIRTSS